MLHQAAFLDGGVLVRDFFHFARVEHAAILVDAVGAAAQHMQVARLVEVAHVAHHHPAIAQRLAGLLGVVPVAVETDRRLHRDEAGGPLGQGFEAVVPYHHLHPGHDPSHRRQDVQADGGTARVHMLMRQQPGDGWQRLQATVALLEDGAEMAYCLGDLGRRHHLRAVGYMRERREAVARQIRVVQQVDDGRRRQKCPRDLVPRNQPCQRGWPEVLRHHQHRARQQRGQYQARARPGERQAQHVDVLPARRGREVDGLRNEAHAVQVLAMAVADGLGQPGGARGHVQCKHLVLVDPGRAARGHGVEQCVFVGPAQGQDVQARHALAHGLQDGLAQRRVVDEYCGLHTQQGVQRGAGRQVLVKAGEDGAVFQSGQPGLVLLAGLGQPGEDDVALPHALGLHPAVQAQHALVQLGVGEGAAPVDEGALAAMQAIGQAGYRAGGAQAAQQKARHDTAQGGKGHRCLLGMPNGRQSPTHPPGQPFPFVGARIRLFQAAPSGRFMPTTGTNAVAQRRPRATASARNRDGLAMKKPPGPGCGAGGWLRKKAAG